MIRWELLDQVALPTGKQELRLYRHDQDFSIRIGPYELMSSRAHHSEDELGRLTALKLRSETRPRVLIGGLGMGFTLRATLNHLKGQSQITVAELVPQVIEWNRTHLAHLAKHPLEDKRVTVYEGDVVRPIQAQRDYYHGIMLDVDNGADGLTQKANERLYSHKGLRTAHSALTTGGVLSIWSAGPDDAFVRRLQKAGFIVEEIKVRARSGRKGGGHTIIWMATKTG